ncbi:MAG: hypothetical protein ACLR56_14545 [Oscillospiraceae bacterium]
MQMLSLSRISEKITARYNVELTDDSYELLCQTKKRDMMIRAAKPIPKGRQYAGEEYRNCKIEYNLRRAENNA